MGNKNLHKARSARNDEFYTRPEDVEKELIQYIGQMDGHVVYCNCDSAKSGIYQTLKTIFGQLALRELVATHYDPDGHPYKLTYDGVTETITPLAGDGDFRSSECRELLAACDTAITNPPFSLARELVPMVIDAGKGLLIIAPINMCTYKQVFPFVLDGRLRIGNTTVKHFTRPDGSIKTFGNTHWFTTMDVAPRKPLVLTKTYSPELYPKYDNYDAIEVGKVADIPVDYDGVMGVPITFLTRHEPCDVEVVGRANNPFIDGVEGYKRIMIKHKAFGIVGSTRA